MWQQPASSSEIVETYTETRNNIFLQLIILIYAIMHLCVCVLSYLYHNFIGLKN